MAIEKRIAATFTVETTFDEPSKTAAFQFPPHIPDEIKSFIERLQAGANDPRYAYIHVVAMTDGDRYGSNLNGDTFSWDELTGLQSQEEADKNPGHLKGLPIPRYKTFEQAKFFKHHDNQEWSPAFGDVAVAARNDALRRLELIIRVARAAVPENKHRSGADSLENYDKNGFFCVSMGTRIGHEKCSICGHENQFTPQRCYHLKNQMNEILPDGRQVTASNHNVRFFDISDVEYNPADTNAIALAKVAGTGPHKVAANPAHDVGFSAPWRKKHSDIIKHLDAEGRDLTVADVAPKYAPKTDGHVQEIAKHVITEAAKSAGLASFLSTAAAMAIVLSPHELLVATAAAEPEKAASFDAEFAGFDLCLDNLDMGAYDALAPYIDSRSGFVAPSQAAGWEPSKLSEAGYPALADYYAFYRDSLSAISKTHFEKVATDRRLIQELIESRDVSFPHAFHHLAHAGITP